MHTSALVFTCIYKGVYIYNVWIMVYSLFRGAYGVSLKGVQPSLMKTDDRELNPLSVSAALHT